VDENRVKKRKKKAAAIICAAVMIALMSGYAALIIWVFSTEEIGAPIFLLSIVLIPLAVIIGIFISLVKRIMEIEKGEEEDAVGKY